MINALILSLQKHNINYNDTQLNLMQHVLRKDILLCTTTYQNALSTFLYIKKKAPNQ